MGTNLLSDPSIQAIVINSRDITERKRAEIERQVFFEVIHALNVTPNLDELLARVHASLKKVVYADNCYVALYEKQTEMFQFHFFMDKFDASPTASAARSSGSTPRRRRKRPGGAARITCSAPASRC